MADWQPIETAPPGYTADAGGFHYVLFLGYSKAGSFAGPVMVSGWMDSQRKPVVHYSYKLRLTHWMPLPDLPGKRADP